MIISADLGSSSIYSNELHVSSINFFFEFISTFMFELWNFEGRSGEGFFVIGDHSKVSRS